jgi:membrane fusion protein, copper/silver efflux system
MKNLCLLFATVFILFSCEPKHAHVNNDVLYTCSMDPQVVSDKPGKCPICGMQLTPVNKSTVENSDDIELSDQQILLGNIRTDTIQKSRIGSYLDLLGTLTTNPAQTVSVNARVMGRIEKLYFKAPGDYIAKKAPVYEIYSEELNSAKQEYIAALKRKTLFKDQSIVDFNQLTEAVANKLRLSGMTEAQISQLASLDKAPLTTTYYAPEGGYVTSINATEGGYVMEGETVLQVTDLSALWAEAQIYASQLFKVPANAVAIVHAGTGEPVEGKIEFTNPELSESSRINILRIAVPNSGNRLKPGMSVNIRVQSSQVNSWTLPTSAIIQGEHGATVWMQTGKNRFRSKMVTTGMESSGLTEIVSGLNEGDVLVVSGTYLLNSEYVFKKGADPMSGHSH